MRTDLQIVTETNELAGYLLREVLGTGYVPEDSDFKFYEAKDPRGQTAWHHACNIMELITKDDVVSALAGIEDPLAIFNVPVPADEMDELLTVAEYREAFKDLEGSGHPVRDGMACEKIWAEDPDKLPEGTTHVAWYGQ